MIRDSFFKLYGARKQWNCGLTRRAIEQELNVSFADEPSGYAWFTLVRDPIERFLSAALEVSIRRMPHPPVVPDEASPAQWRLNGSLSKFSYWYDLRQPRAYARAIP